jgi:predicted transposase/invertase (TIGR01784 family)
MTSKKNQKSATPKSNTKMFYGPVYEKYIDPLTDSGFKKLFGEECNKDLLLDFLNELLYEEQGRIVSISYLQSEKLGFAKDSRKALVDLYCENEKGEKFIVEMQKERQEFFKDRALFYSTFPIIEQAPKRKKWNFELKAVYIIALLDFVFEEDKDDLDKYRYDIKLTDIQTKKVFYDKLTFIYLEMPKFNKEIDELKTRFEKWMYVIKNIQELEDLPEKLNETIFAKMFEEAEISQLTQKEYISYVKNVSIIRDNINCMDFAIKTAVIKAEEEARAKGMAEGKAEGLREGQEIMVRNSAKAGLPIKTIATITGLPMKDVKKMLEKH